MKNVFLLLVLAALSSCGSNDKPCNTKETCINNQNCQCWCSVKCGFRDKVAKDSPIWVDKDNYGKYCYCKQWDYDHYQDNCVKGRNIPEPEQ